MLRNKCCLDEGKTVVSESLKSSKWLMLAALFMFVGATFQIADGHWACAALCFGAAASFMALAGRRRKLENVTNRGKR